MKLKHWTKKERQLLKDYYGKISIEELLEMLPDRTEASIVSQVSYLRKRGWTFNRRIKSG